MLPQARIVAPPVTDLLEEATARSYVFATEAEADATYLITAWFTISESAALGIFPIMAALNDTHKHGHAYFDRFMEHGFQHFVEEQSHANLWCQALMDFNRAYPEVVRRVKLPNWLLNVMLKSVGKPHSVAAFGVDCLAFELALRAMYDVITPRLHYPPVASIFRTISRDEIAHTDFDRAYFEEVADTSSKLKRAWVAQRFWRNVAGVVITLQPLLSALNKHSLLEPGEYRGRLAHYLQQSGVPGSQRIPALLATGL